MPDFDSPEIDYSFGLPPEKRRLLGLTQFALPLANSAAPPAANPSPSTLDTAPKPSGLGIQPSGLTSGLADEMAEPRTARGARNSLAIMPTNFYEGASSRPRVPTVQPPQVDIANPMGTSARNPLAIQPATDLTPKRSPLEDFYRDNPQRPKLKGIKRVFDVLGDIFAPTVEQAIPGSPGNYDVREAQAFAKEKGLANIEDVRSQAREREGKLALDIWKTQQPPKQERAETIDQLIADASDQAQREGRDPNTDPKVLQLVDVRQRGQRETPGRRLTNAFEAFAYGTPEQKQAAKDFIDYEKRIGARYRTPNEFDLRYKLFKEDPETYRAMFGDKGAAADERARIADRAHAARMLSFFQRQRDEISKNFMLGDDEKAQKLAEIDEMERPFKEAASMGETGDRVNVIAPNGTPGTIPRSQLGKAKKKGYREAQ